MTAVTVGQPMPTPQRQRRVVLGPVLGLIALGICGLVVLALVGTTVGTAGVVVGIVCALVPVGPVVATFLWVDRWEPEPPRLLLFAFLWGAGFAALSSLIINSTAAVVADAVLGQGSGDVIGAVVVAPVVEEAMKGAFLVGLLLLRRREFDGITDGIVYAGLVAAGFAFTENILYLGRAFAEEQMMAGASGAVLGTLFLRGVLSPFAHPLFTAMIGIAAGVAAGQRSTAARVGTVALGYVGAVLLHALWNGSATFFGGGAFFGVYLLVMLPLFVGMIVLVVWQRGREQRIVVEQLPGFAQAGWIAPTEVPLLSSMAGRRGWKAAVQRRSGKPAAKAVGDYQAAVTELAFLRARIARGSVSASARQWHDEVLRELFAARRRAIGMPEALTAAWRLPPPTGWTPPPAQWQPPPTPPYGWAPPSPAWPPQNQPQPQYRAPHPAQHPPPHPSQHPPRQPAQQWPPPSPPQHPPPQPPSPPQHPQPQPPPQQRQAPPRH
ncbi:MAG: PrsW family intramembrane metalloprotease [Pseudonocardia sp.]